MCKCGLPATSEIAHTPSHSRNYEYPSVAPSAAIEEWDVVSLWEYFLESAWGSGSNKAIENT